MIRNPSVQRDLGELVGGRCLVSEGIRESRVSNRHA